MSEIYKFIHNPLLLFGSLGHRGFFNWMNDEQYLKILFKIRIGQELNLNNPQAFNEKLQWLKLHDRRPEYTMMVDKYAVKKYVSEKIGEQYIIPTLGVWDKFDDIDFDQLPDRFVLKCTHDSGGLVICRDKANFNIRDTRKKINRCLKQNYFWGCREWPYKNVKPRIIAEKYMEDEILSELRDYKFFCFDGKPMLLFIASDRHKNCETKFDFFDIDFNYLNITNGHPNSKNHPKKPLNFNLMVELSKKLSKNIPHVRVDFYEINGNVYFGELTFYHWSGLVKFNPSEWDLKLGKMLKLPKKVE